MSYISRDELKAQLTLSGASTFADADIDRAISAATGGIDFACGRTFTPASASVDVRYYSPEDSTLLDIDDLATLATVKTDGDGDGAFETTWTYGTDFVLEPENAGSDNVPVERVRVHPRGRYTFPTAYPRSVEVTAIWGWPSVPGPVSAACGIIAAKLLIRMRQAPMGILVVGAGETAVAARLAAGDPDAAWLLAAYTRRKAVGSVQLG